MPYFGILDKKIKKVKASSKCEVCLQAIKQLPVKHVSSGTAARRVLTVVRMHDTCEKPADSSLFVEYRISKD